jgi:acyl-CoA synthetase (AMP-forming)/AMP-acid ligase II
MNFWDLDAESEQRSAVIDAEGQVHSATALLVRVTQQERALAALGSRTMGFVLCDNRLADLALYLACLRRGHVPLLLAAQTPPEQLAALQARYQPQWISTHGEPLPQPGASAAELHPALGLLLSTSGTTGSPRLVRLTRAALQANAASIGSYLQLTAQERAITSLPMHYSYGLSVLNSHLLAGATLVLNTDSVFSREFLQRLREQQVTSLAGVPYMYQVLHRTAFFKQELPALRTLTQAGGRMDEKLMHLVAEHAQASGRRFFVMYGQTEACARISYVPPAQLLKKIGSIGVPIPGGALEVAADSGELIYRGPNVMLGYAEQRADLARGDDCQGRLPTGDLGRVDEDGFFYITGRLKRFIKVGGNRIGLDEVEQALQAAFQVPLAVGGTDDRLVVWLESPEATLLDQAREFVRQQYAIHPTMTRLQLVEQLPLLPSGKKDYGSLLRS